MTPLTAAIPRELKMDRMAMINVEINLNQTRSIDKMNNMNNMSNRFDLQWLASLVGRANAQNSGDSVAERTPDSGADQIHRIETHQRVG